MRISESLFNLDEKKLKYILDYVLDCYINSRDWKIEKKYTDMAKECYRFYRGIPIMKPEAYQHQSNYFRPLTFSAVETILPRLMASIFATDPFLRYLGVDDNDVPKADNLTKLVFHKLVYEVPYYLAMNKVLKNALVYGYCCLYAPWLLKTKTRYIREATTSKKIAVNQDVIDSAYPTAIPIWDVYPQPDIESIHDGDYGIIRELITPSELWQRALRPGSPYLIENVQKILASSPSISYPIDTDTNHYQELDGIIGLGESSKRRVNKIELLHYWGVFELNSDVKNHPEISTMETWITIANRTQVVLCRDNPFDCQERPIFEFKPAPNTHGLIGIPVPMMARDTQLEANDMMNFRLDQLNFIGNKVMKVKRHSDIYEKLQGGDIILYPGATIPVDNQDDLESVDFGTLDPSLYLDDNILANEFDKAIGIHDITTGKGDPRARTATGTSLVIREANYRFDAMLKHINPAMMQSLQFIGYLNQQFALPYGEKKSFSLIDMLYPTKKETFSFSAEDIQCAFQTVILSSSTRGDKSYHLALLQSLRQLTGNAPHVNLYEFDRQLFETAEMKNIDLLLKKMPPSVPLEAQTLTEGNNGSLGTVVGGFKGLGGPLQDKSNLGNLIIEMQKDRIV